MKRAKCWLRPMNQRTRRPVQPDWSTERRIGESALCFCNVDDLAKIIGRRNQLLAPVHQTTSFSMTQQESWQRWQRPSWCGAATGRECELTPTGGAETASSLNLSHVASDPQQVRFLPSAIARPAKLRVLARFTVERRTDSHGSPWPAWASLHAKARSLQLRRATGPIATASTVQQITVISEMHGCLACMAWPGLR